MMADTIAETVSAATPLPASRADDRHDLAPSSEVAVLRIAFCGMSTRAYANLNTTMVITTDTFMKKALKRNGSPEAITTDGLSSYRAAMTELGNAEKQEVGRCADNRVRGITLSRRPHDRSSGRKAWRSKPARN